MHEDKKRLLKAYDTALDTAENAGFDAGYDEAMENAEPEGSYEDGFGKGHIEGHDTGYKLAIDEGELDCKSTCALWDEARSKGFDEGVSSVEEKENADHTREVEYLKTHISSWVEDYSRADSARAKLQDEVKALKLIIEQHEKDIELLEALNGRFTAEAKFDHKAYQSGYGSGRLKGRMEVEDNVIASHHELMRLNEEGK